MKIILNILLVVILGSCITQKELEYLQKPIEDKASELNNLNGFKPPIMHKIKPNDELIIKVSSFDDISFNYFNTQSEGSSLQASNELSVNALSYSIDIDGYVYFPVVGKIKMAGLTLEQAREKLRIELTPYFDQPNVSVKYAYKKVTVLGEVNSPGYYTYTKDQISIFEVLAMSSDLTIHGNRKEIILIRNEENKAVKYEIDLTDDDLVFNYNYYLQPGDIIYVKPRGSVRWSVISTPVSLLFSTITTALLVYDAIQN